MKAYFVSKELTQTFFSRLFSAKVRFDHVPKLKVRPYSFHTVFRPYDLEFVCQDFSKDFGQQI